MIQDMGSARRTHGAEGVHVAQPLRAARQRGRSRHARRRSHRALESPRLDLLGGDHRSEARPRPHVYPSDHCRSISGRNAEKRFRNFRWLRMQADYDLWQAMQQPAPKVVRVKAVAS
jgi:hypothetical protein